MASLAIDQFYGPPHAIGGSGRGSCVEQYLSTDRKFRRKRQELVAIDTPLRAGVRLATSTGELPLAICNAIDEVLKLEQLPANWNSYGGRPLQDSAVKAAFELLVESEKMCQAPRLLLASHGGLDLIWESAARYLEVTVWPDQTCEVSYEDSDVGETFDTHDRISTAAAVEHLKRFCSVR
jgi:hypothetical protein